jgi:hypothetical protein
MKKWNTNRSARPNSAQPRPILHPSFSHPPSLSIGGAHPDPTSLFSLARHDCAAAWEPNRHGAWAFALDPSPPLSTSPSHASNGRQFPLPSPLPIHSEKERPPCHRWRLKMSTLVLTVRGARRTVRAVPCPGCARTIRMHRPLGRACPLPPRPPCPARWALPDAQALPQGRRWLFYILVPGFA